MSNFIYETPTKAYSIRSSKSGLFEDVTVYHVCKYDESLAKMKSDGINVSDYYIVSSYESLKTCFKWLRDKNIISNDEYKSLLKKHNV